MCNRHNIDPFLHLQSPPVAQSIFKIQCTPQTDLTALALQRIEHTKWEPISQEPAAARRAFFTPFQDNLTKMYNRYTPAEMYTILPVELPIPQSALEKCEYCIVQVRGQNSPIAFRTWPNFPINTLIRICLHYQMCKTYVTEVRHYNPAQPTEPISITVLHDTYIRPGNYLLTDANSTEIEYFPNDTHNIIT